MYKKYPKGLKLTPEKQHLVDDNMGIAVKLSHKWYNGAVEYDDIEQQAFLTLVDCATKFDLSKGNKFSTYAYSCIDLVLNNYVQNYNKSVRIPLHKIYKLYKYTQLPDDEKEEFKKRNKLSDEDITLYVNYEILSLDAQVVDDYNDVSNFYASDEKGYDEINDNVLIENILLKLELLIEDKTQREVFKKVIENDFDKTTYKDIAKKFGIKLKDVYNIVENCQKIMKENKDLFI